jgi:bifunctional non-homologous end joining protein LigD
LKMVKMVPYVLHKHFSRKAGEHYDFRMKYPTRNMLISFALPKGELPRKEGDKKLAIQTPDHSMNWLRKEGEIEIDNYNHDTIHIEQTGILSITHWSKDKITFTIEGHLLDGKFSLVKFKDKVKNSRWLLVKGKS